MGKCVRGWRESVCGEKVCMGGGRVCVGGKCVWVECGRTNGGLTIEQKQQGVIQDFKVEGEMRKVTRKCC